MSQLHLPDGSIGTALFSTCRRFRYRLTRTLEPGNPRRVLFVLLNPSTATADKNDPTVRRCMGFGRAWGFGTLEVVNVFAYRATEPEMMKCAEDPVGPDNDSAIRLAAMDSDLVVCAWGAHGRFLDRSTEVRRLLARFSPTALALTSAGEPRHPLYLRADLKPFPLPPACPPAPLSP